MICKTKLYFSILLYYLIKHWVHQFLKDAKWILTFPQNYKVCQNFNGEALMEIERAASGIYQINFFSTSKTTLDLFSSEKEDYYEYEKFW